MSVYGESTNKSGIYGTIAVIFLFQGFYAFSITPLTTVYPTEVSNYTIRTTGIAIFRMLDSGFGLLSSFALSFAMADLGWKFYFINASWVIVFLLIIYFTWVETRGLTLEEIGLKFEGDVALQGEIVEEQTSPTEDPLGKKCLNESKKTDEIVVSIQ